MSGSTTESGYACCFCYEGIELSTEGEAALDRCALTVTAHYDRSRKHQKEQTFYCHIRCFKERMHDPRVLELTEPDCATFGEIWAEAEANSDPGS